MSVKSDLRYDTRHEGQVDIHLCPVTPFRKVVGLKESMYVGEEGGVCLN